MVDALGNGGQKMDGHLLLPHDGHVPFEFDVRTMNAENDDAHGDDGLDGH